MSGDRHVHPLLWSAVVWLRRSANVSSFVLCSGKASLLSKRNVKKTDSGKSDGASYEMPGSPEDVERNQKILQWIIEGEKEISRHKKTNHG